MDRDSRDIVNSIKYELVSQFDLEELNKARNSLYNYELQNEMVEEYQRRELLLLPHFDSYYRIALEEVTDYISSFE